MAKMLTTRSRLIERWVTRESAWCARANRWGRIARFRALMTLVSRIGDGPVWYALMAALVALDGMRGLIATLHMAGTGFVALMLYLGIKRWSRRLRPYERDRRIEALTPALDRYSFPSGHTLHALAFTWVAVAWYPTLAIVLYPLTALIALSRVVLGLHFPTDVAASIALATLLGTASRTWGPTPLL